MPDIKRTQHPTILEHLQQEKQGLRRLKELGWRGALLGRKTVTITAEQAENLLLIGGAVRQDIVETIRLQLDTSDETD